MVQSILNYITKVTWETSSSLNLRKQKIPPPPPNYSSTFFLFTEYSPNIWILSNGREKKKLNLCSLYYQPSFPLNLRTVVGFEIVKLRPLFSD